MYSKTIKQIAVLCCLFWTSALNGQITIDYPENLTIECGTDLTPSVDNPIIGYPEISTTCASGLTDITFSDNIDRLVDCGGTGILLRFWSVSDNCGGFMTLLQQINIQDNTPPEITCIPEVVIECEASLNPAENPDLAFPTIIDCSEGEDLTITYTDVNEGDGFCDNLPEIVRRTWTVTDACGNVSTCEQNIRVGKDPLLVFCDIADIVHECNGLDGSRFAAESWDLSNTNQLRNCTQTDCGPVEIISDFDYGRLMGACGITGGFDVNYLIKDNCGNTKFKTVSFLLRDTTPPESFCNPVDFGVSCEGDETAATRVEGWHNDNIALLETCLFDNCGEVVVSSNFNASNFDISQLNFDCNDDTGFAVDYTLTDDCGNTTVKTAFLKVVDNTAPVFENIPRDTSIGASDNLAIGQPTIIDNCSSNLSSEFSEERIDNANDNGYQLIRTWTTTDDCGNVGTASQRVMVLDPILSLACTSAEVKLVGDKIEIANLLAPNEIVKVFAADNRVVYNCFRNCGEIQTTRPLSPDVYKVEIEFYTENWRLICSDNVEVTVGDGGNNNEDENGNNMDNNTENEDPCTATDCEQMPPVLSNLAADMTVNADEVPAPRNPTATDNCDTDVVIDFNEVRENGESDDSYVLTRTWVATDDCGNTAMGEQVIRVLGSENTGNDNNDPCNGADCETISPIIGNVPMDITVDASAVPAPAQPTATDNCDTNVDLVLSETISESIDTRNYTLTRTWTATDNCENKTTKKQVISVTGEIEDNSGNENGNNDNNDENNDDENGNNDNNHENNDDENDNDNNIDNDVCNQVNISTSPLSFNFDNLNAPNKIIKIFDEEYNILLECSEGCGTEVSFSYETLGTYIADVQLYTANWEFICETRSTVVLSDEPTDPENENDPENGNVDVADSACNNVEINITSNVIEITNIDAPNQLIKLFDEQYDLIAECANDCADPVTFNLPPIGNYFVDVQLYTDNWEFICESQEAISVTDTNNGNESENGNENNNDNGSTIDTPCDEVTINNNSSAIMLSNFSTSNKIINVFDENFNLIYNCFTDCTDEVSIPISANGNYLVDLQLYNLEWGLRCQQRQTISITENTTGPETTTDDNNLPNNSIGCEAIEIAAINNQITVENLNYPNSIVKVFSENFDLIFECVGTCGETAIATDLLDGNYQVNVDFFDENWVEICEHVAQVSLSSNTATSENPLPNSAANASRLIHVSSLLNTKTFTLYPNPATSELMVNLFAFKGQAGNLIIYNQLAKEVWKENFQTVEQTIHRIDLQSLNNGLYLVSLQIEGKAPISQKLLVNKDR